MGELKMMAGYAKRYAAAYVLGLLSLMVVDQLLVYIPQYTGEITDGLESGAMDSRGVMVLLAKILIMGIFVTIGRFGWRFFIIRPSRAVERDMRNDLFVHLETLSVRYFNEHKTGDLMAHFTNDLQAVRNLLGMTIVTSFDASIMMILVLFKMAGDISMRLTFAAVLPLFLIMIGDYIYGKLMHKRFLEKQEAFSLLTDQVQETVSGIRVIKAFVQERKELEAFARTNLFNMDKNMGVVKLRALFIPILDFVVGFSGLLTLLYGGYLAIAGEISLGQFVAFNSYISMLVWPMMAAGECITALSQGLASMRRIRSIMEEKPEIRDLEWIKPVEELKGEIEIRDLTFTYPEREQETESKTEQETKQNTDQKTEEETKRLPALDGISLRIQKGSTLAVIGRTGSGKTTLANLLLHLYQTRPGEIRIDGHSMEEIPLKILRRDIAYVPQDNFLFSDTLENNIAFGLEKWDSAQVEEAAKQACIHENIIEFPLKYQTPVGERGVTLSGGQKQRSSIARAFMKDAPILILDDALSAVDTDTEERILTNLKKLRKGKTTIIIAHRISTIQKADHIMVLDDGKKMEYGTHEELMALHGIYRSIYEKQQLEKMLREEDPDDTENSEKGGEA